MKIVKIKNLKKSYEKGNIKALNGINLEINEGEFIAIIGPSGSGKSTLLNMLGGLDIADEGTIEVAGYDIGKKDLSEFDQEK
jgi:putative ABC transport system ATP-binding protein